MNAHSKPRGTVASKISSGEMATLDNGSLVVPPDRLAWFGNGDVARGRQELRLLIEAEHDRSVMKPAPVTACPPTVRIAVPADEAAIMALLLEDANENASRIAMVDADRIRGMVQTCLYRLTDKGVGTIAVIDGPDNKPVAVTVLWAMQWWWSREFYFQEIVNFVSPEHRRSRHIHDLIAFEQWWVDAHSKDYGHRVYLFCGVLGMIRTYAKAILYRRKMKQVGTGFLYPCPYGDDARIS